jgi:hypothetical protein
MRTKVSLLCGLVALLLGAFIAPAAATAAPASSENLAAERAVVARLANAADPQAEAKALSASDRALLQQAMTQLTGVTRVAIVGRSDPTTASGTLAANGQSMVPMNTSCWYYYWYVDWYDLGYKDGSTWMRADWCTNGSSIVSPWSVSLLGGQGYLGNSYRGVAGTGALNVNWEVRQYAEFHFNFWGADAWPCMQIRGGAAGNPPGTSEWKTCNLNA